MKAGAEEGREEKTRNSCLRSERNGTRERSGRGGEGEGKVLRPKFICPDENPN